MRCSFFRFSCKILILSIFPSGDARKFELIEKIKFILHKSAINWNYLKFSFAFAREIPSQSIFLPSPYIFIRHRKLSDSTFESQFQNVNFKLISLIGTNLSLAFRLLLSSVKSAYFNARNDISFGPIS